MEDQKLSKLRQEVEEMEKIDFKSLSPTQLENYSNKLDGILRQSTDYILNMVKNIKDEEIPIDKDI